MSETMKNIDNANIARNRGFTLIEIMVVMVILGLLVAIALGSMMAGLGVAAFRESNALLVAGVSLFLPVIGPILFLVKPKVEYEDENDEDEEYEYEEAETPAGATMTDTGGGAVAGPAERSRRMARAALMDENWASTLSSSDATSRWSELSAAESSSMSADVAAVRASMRSETSVRLAAAAESA